MMSSSEMSLSLTRAFSPPMRYDTSSWSSHSWSTSTVTRLGITQSLSPTRMVPCSTLPSTMVPMSLYFERMGSRSALSRLRSQAGSWSSTSRKQGPSIQPGSENGAMTLAAVSAEMGTKTTSFLTLYPQPFRKGESLSLHSSKRSFDHFTVGSSILLMTTTSSRTPRVFASNACSRVCPPRSKPVSNSPLRAEMTSTPTSAWHAPAIMFGT
mmetsp:Transcript_34620/g.114688  ORF Transcript_34620/g.114688 Transcript_34620/m.114688 type:complete len:211 (+) Transcript_34620:455-1087(+)